MNSHFELKCATFNLRAIQFPDRPSTWSKRLPLIAEFIESSSADIVGVQELLPRMKRDLEGVLSGYSFVGGGRRGFGRDSLPLGEQSAILSRDNSAVCTQNETFWLSKNPEKPGSRILSSIMPRICTVAEFDVGGVGKTVRVYNTHLDHISRMARLFQIGVILRHIEEIQKISPRPTILMGDFNATPDSLVVKAVTEFEPIKFRSAYSGDGYSFRYPKFLGARLFDYIFTSDGITVTDAYIDNSKHYGSDHFPLVASLSVRRFS